MTDKKLKQSISRERVLNISLLDFFVQLIFLLIIMLGVGYFSIDKEKFDKFIKNGREIYGDSFDKDWLNRLEEMSSKIKEQNETIESLEQKVRMLVGFDPCLKSDDKFAWSVAFSVHNGYLKFDGFSEEFKSHASDKLHIQYANIKPGLSFYPNKNSMKEFKNTFSFINESEQKNSLDKCYHMFHINDDDSWVTDNTSHNQHKLLLGLPYTEFKPYIKLKGNKKDENKNANKSPSIHDLYKD